MSDIVGKDFGRLLVLEETTQRRRRSKLYRCLCECGREHLAVRNDLVNGRTRSCGCLRREASRARVTAYNAVRDANL